LKIFTSSMPRITLTNHFIQTTKIHPKMLIYAAVQFSPCPIVHSIAARFTDSHLWNPQIYRYKSFQQHFEWINILHHLPSFIHSMNELVKQWQKATVSQSQSISQLSSHIAFPVRVIIVWNRLPTHVVLASSLLSFKIVFKMLIWHTL